MEVLENVEGYFEDGQANQGAVLDAGENQGFPKLSEVPNAPRPASANEDLDQLSEGLIADRDEARYTNQTLRSRYADGAPTTSENMASENSVKAQSKSTPNQKVIQRKELRSAESAGQVHVAATKRRVARSSSSLAEERRIGNIEPASGAVLRDQWTGSEEGQRIVGLDDGTVISNDGRLADSQQIVSGQTVHTSKLSETARARENHNAAKRQTSSRAGVMAVSQFRAMFNERFDSSGRSPYHTDERHQVAVQVDGDAVLRGRTVSPNGSDMNQTFAGPLHAAQESRDNGQAMVSFQAASIPFAVGSASLNSSDRAALKEVVKLHQKFGGTVHVVGHASQRTRDMGTENHRMVNFNLSLDRATAVSMELARLGIPAEAVAVIARSDNEPFAYEYMPEGEAYNRRADVYLEY